jgi:hypothetical protein
MCKQKLISNKFDLNLTTTLSSYWCTAIFTKSRSLHYVLKKKKVNETEENDAFYIDHVRSTKQKKRHTRTTYDAHQLNQARITASSKHAEETTFKERRFQHTERHAEQRR